MAVINIRKKISKVSWLSIEFRYPYYRHRYSTDVKLVFGCMVLEFSKEVQSEHINLGDILLILF